MAKIRKQFQKVYEVLSDPANAKKQTKTTLALLMPVLATQSPSYLRSISGITVTAVYCKYHKKWEPVSEVDYLPKKGTASGLCNTCKEGVSRYHKQNNEFNKRSLALPGLIKSKGVSIDDIEALLEEIDAIKSVVVPRTDGIGFDTLEEIESYLLPFEGGPEDA